MIAIEKISITLRKTERTDDGAWKIFLRAEITSGGEPFTCTLTCKATDSEIIAVNDDWDCSITKVCLAKNGYDSEGLVLNAWNRYDGELLSHTTYSRYNPNPNPKFN